MIDFLVIFIISTVANFFSALAGGGAGLIQLPALIFLGLPFTVALATHKIATVALGLGATIRHLRSTQFQLFFSIILLTGIPGAYIGANLILQVPDIIATQLLGGLTMSLALYSFLQPKLGQQSEAIHFSTTRMTVGIIGLFFLGILNGSLTSGTGLFVTLWMVTLFKLEYKLAIAYTMVFVGLFWNGIGAITLGLQSEIYWQWLPELIVGSLVGGYAGAHFSTIANNLWIKRIFELVTLFVGLKLLLT
ncbi:MAG: sulfite exporter TauE/SafE family protein [Thiotrichaceae bacterium]|nr:sulfite exporter TauE/SafE family protein [Thiotrichaceae bacterium]